MMINYCNEYMCSVNVKLFNCLHTSGFVVLMIPVVYTVSSFFHSVIFLSLMTLLQYHYYYGTLLVLFHCLIKIQHSAD